MITASQLRAARALLDVSQGEIAEAIGVSANTISNIEKGSKPSMDNALALEKFFDEHGVEFLENDGLRRKKIELATHEGPGGFRTFLDDVYETARTVGGEMCLFNARPLYWNTHLDKDWYAMHTKRMTAVKNNINMKITVESGDKNFIASDFAEYRWFPKNMFNEKAFYSYGQKLAFLNFENHDVNILVLKQKDFAAAFRVLFNIGWDNVATKAGK